VAFWLAERALRLATPEYRAFLTMTSRLGVAALAPALERRETIKRVLRGRLPFARDEDHVAALIEEALDAQ
jgi:hypothetical protein